MPQPLSEWLTTQWPALAIAVGAVPPAALIWRALREKPARTGQRTGLWFVALVFTFFGPFSTVTPAWPVTDWASAINAEANFKDIWLAYVGMVVLSLSNVVDNLVRAYEDISTPAQFMVPIILAIDIIGLALGMWQYGSLSNGVLPYTTFQMFWTIVWITMIFSFFVELLIVVEGKD